MKLSAMTALMAALILLPTAQAKVPVAKKAEVVTSFGNSPLNEAQLKALNEILATSTLSAPAVAKPAPAPAKTTSKPSKLKPAKKKEQDKDKADDDDRELVIRDGEDAATTLVVDPKTASFKNLKVPAAQTGAVKELLTSLKLTK